MTSSVAADSSVGRMPLHPCGVCAAIPLTPTDQFCRKCGSRLALECMHCHASIRVQDRFCAHCGHRRIALFDIFRYGLVSARSPAVVLGTAVVVGAAWLGLRYALRHKL